MTRMLMLLAMPENVRQRYRAGVQARFPDLDIDVVDHHSKVDPHIADADILMTFGPMMSDRVLAQATRLKWVLALGTGVDGIVDQPSLPPGVLVTNLHGVHGPPVSEAALASMLALSRQLPRSVRNQGARRWERFPATLLHEKTVGIFGIGVIAEALAPKCKALGMKVVGISSAPRAVAGFDHVFPREALQEAVRGLDYLVLLTPLTPATRHSVDAAVLGALKPGTFLVNLARGGVVDEPALIDALNDRRIGGAALDVFDQEPLPADHPFWAMDNVIVTAHQGGFCDVYVDYAMPVIEANLRKFLAGDTAGMINVVAY